MAKIIPLGAGVGTDTSLAGLVKGAVPKALREGFGIETVGDLLRHYPRRYAERAELTAIADLIDGEDATVVAEIKSVNGRYMRSRKGHLLDLVVTDGRSDLTLAFFNQPWRMKFFEIGQRCLVYGKVGSYRGRLQLAHPEVVLLTDDAVDDDSAESVEAFAGALIPVYPATGKLNSGRIMGLIRQLLDHLDAPPDPIPPDIRAARGLVDLRTAFDSIHRPSTREEIHAASKRFRYEEAFVLQCELARRRSVARALPATPRTGRKDGLLAAFDERLPFELTDGQRGIGDAIEADLEQSHPMQRLLQGEVGSGKTVCAVRAMLTVVDSGGQAALLAPTEVLAQQHHRTITELLGPLAERGMLGGAEHGTRVALITGSLGAAARRKALLEVASGEAGIVVGTHALLEDRVSFADLGLVVIDEQHRFGVEQRAALTAKNAEAPPHVLVMTATPIPRTVAMTVFGDLEISTLTELPKGRAAVQTSVVPVAEKPAWLERVWERVREEVGNGRQAYVVCPRIGSDSDTDDTDDTDDTEEGIGDLLFGDQVSNDQGSSRPQAQALVDVAAELSAGPLSELRVDVLHGRLPADAKDEVMRRFAAGEVDVLVATTVIEVGVDVPNASVMVVMDADWFGVSQLHQLRGRIGRGGLPGLCLLVSNAEPETPARERLTAVASTTDGFELSRLDLEQRREGDVLGDEQSGRRSSLRMLKVIRDEAVIGDARTDAIELIEAMPDLSAYAPLADAVAALDDGDRADYLEKT